MWWKFPQILSTCSWSRRSHLTQSSNDYCVDVFFMFVARDWQVSVMYLDYSAASMVGEHHVYHYII